MLFIWGYSLTLSSKSLGLFLPSDGLSSAPGFFLSFLFFSTLFNKVEKVHRHNAGEGGDELPIHHGVSVQGHEENLAAAS